MLDRWVVIAVSLLFLALFQVTGYGNLVPNAGFEQDRDGDGLADGWNANIHPGAEGRVELSAAGYRGGRALHIVHENDSGEWVRSSVLRIDVRPQALCRLSGWVKATSSWQVTLYEFKEDGSYDSHALAGGGPTPWKRFVSVLPLTADARYVKLSLITMRHGEAWFDDMQMDDLTSTPRLRLPRLVTAPTLDGTATEEAWETATVIEDFALLDRDGAAPSASTLVRMGVFENQLWVSWECQEPRLAEQRLGDTPGWDQDTLELFLVPPSAGSVFHYGVTPAGGRLAQLHPHVGGKRFAVDWYSSATTGEPTDAGVLPPYTCAAWRGTDAWSAEMCVDLGQVPELSGAATWRLQLARSRKVGDLEENSCWAFTPGAVFRVVERFGRVAFPRAGMDDQAVIRPVVTDPPSQVTLVPEPRQVTWLPEVPHGLISSPVSIAVSGASSGPAAALLERLLKERFGLANTRVPDAAAATIVLSDALSSVPVALEDWQREEAYHLICRDGTIRIQAQGVRGALYGVQTLRQVLTRRDGRIYAPAVDITDWPGMRWRGWHLISPEKSEYVDEAMRVLDVLAALKMNWVSFQIDNRLRYEGDPDLARDPDVPTKADLRTLNDHARSLGLDVIPMTQCWSHFSYFLNKPKYRPLAEIQEPADNARWRFWNYCPRHPETHPLLFGMIEEQLECFPGATTYHVGLDEITFEPIGQCERCKDATGGELFAEEIGRLHGFLKSKGLRMAMWGDQLLVENNGKYFQTAEALPHVPRDVIIFDWHYGASQAYPSLAFLKDKGFDVVACGWYEPLNVIDFAAEASRQGVLGYGGTTWYGIHDIRNEVRLMTGMVLSADVAWRGCAVEPDTLAYEPAQVYRDLWELAPEPRAFIPVDISYLANTRLLDSPLRPGWMGLGADNDLRSFPTGRQWLGGIPFEILPPDQNQCIMLAAQDDPNGSYPEEAWNIGVGTQVQALAFLQTCSRPERFSRHIYDRQKINPGRVATIAVRYEDGSTEEVVLDWNRTIADWNSQLGSAAAHSAWVGKTDSGARARIETLVWRNPYPDKTVEAVDVLSGHTTVRPVLLGITAITSE